MSIWIIFIGISLISWLVSSRLQSKMRKYAQVPLYGLTGRDVADRMLAAHGIRDVQIVPGEGFLTDHYNPQNKTVSLSPDVYYGNHVTAAAVAAHECGHAVQHAHSYKWLQMRSTLVPAVTFASKWVQWVLLAGILLIQSFPQILGFGVILFAMTTLFSFITLPVEIDASRRALAWLKTAGVTTNETQEKAQDGLKWAAYTYVAAALGSLATLIYYAMLFMGASGDD